MKKGEVAVLGAFLLLLVLGGCALPMGLDVKAAPVTGEDLEGLVPAPVTGAMPLPYLIAPSYTGAVVWKNGELPLSGAFRADTFYTAVITLHAAAGYTFTGMPTTPGEGSFRHSRSVELSHGAGTGMTLELTIRFGATGPAAGGAEPAGLGLAHDLDLTVKIPAPVKGGTPATYFSAPQYTGELVWSAGGQPLGGLFEANTAYTATATLTAASGYTFEGITGSFTHAGARALDLAAATGAAVTVTVAFPETTSVAVVPVSDLSLDYKVPAPVRGETPALYVSASQYTGWVDWSAAADGQPLSGLFEGATAYTAKATLTAASGYTFGASPGNFVHRDADPALVPNPAIVDNGNGTITATVTFPATDAVPEIPVNDLDLSYRVPAPVLGGTPATYFAAPQYTGNVAWSTGGQPFSGLFEGATAYTATVTLTAAVGYTFEGATGSFAHARAPNAVATAGNTATIAFPATTSVAAIPVSDLNLSYRVPVPVRGGTPALYFAAPQYTGNVAWSAGAQPFSGLFAANTVYTATVTLTAASGYTLEGISGSFAHTGDSVVVATTGDTVTIVFPATTSVAAVPVNDLDLTYKVAAPVRGGTAALYFAAPQYTGSVAWSVAAGGQPLNGLFEAGTAYTATITLTAASGYTLVGANGSFAHARASAVSGAREVVIVSFPETTSVTAVTVSDLDLYYKVPAPARGETPVIHVSAFQYTGWVDWSADDRPLGGLFEANTVYTAKVTLTAASGYAFGNPAGNFDHQGAAPANPAAVNNDDGTITVSVVFPATAGVVELPVNNLDLTAKVPAPVRGGTPTAYFSAPQYTGEVDWSAGGQPFSGLFEGATAYTATVTLSAASGYTFAGASGSFTHAGAEAITTAGGNGLVLSVLFPATTTVAAIPVSDLNLTGKVAAPVRGGTAATYFSAPQYTGNVVWSVYPGGQPLGGLFEANTRYRATVTLSAASGYTLDGVAGAFTHGGASIVTHVSNDTVALIFPATTIVAAIPVSDLDLTYKVAAPVRGGTAEIYFAAPQYTGNVVWSVYPGGQTLGGLFGENTRYRATVTLTAASGYTLAGISGSFSHAGALIITHTVADTVTITFPATTSVTAATVSDLNLTAKVAAPVRGGIPATYFSTPQYAGSVAWSVTSGGQPLSGLFGANTGYTATVTLSAASGYTLAGLAANAFAHTGSSSIVYGGGVATIVFSPTTKVAAIPVNDLNLTYRVPAPVRGGTATAYFSAPQYTGNVAWSVTSSGQPLKGVFASGTGYTATVTLSAASGYTLDGAGSFVHSVATAIGYANGGAVTLAFQATDGDVLAAVSDLNLTAKVARPVRGGTPALYFSAPQYTGAVEWSETLSGQPLTGLFEAGTGYTATVTLSAASGYTLAGALSNVFTHTGASSIVNTTGDVVTATISFSETTSVEAVKVSDLDLTYMVPAPVRGGTPAAYVSESQYTGWVVWSAGGQPLSGLFAADTAYTATVTLSAASGYTFDGVAANAFTHGGKDSIANAANTGTVTIVFKATEKVTAAAVSDPDLSAKVAAPARGGTPAFYFSAPQYAGTVVWSVGGTAFTGLFDPLTVYTATVTLTAASGYTLDGLAANAFAHTGASSVVYNPGAKTVVIVFKATGNAPAAVVNDLNLTAKLAAPVRGGTPTAYFSAPQYTGSVAWKRTGNNTPLSGLFEPLTVYTATVTLSTASGYTLTGLAANAFTHTGASSVAYNAGVVTIVFTDTGNVAAAAVNDLDLSYRVPRPVTGGTPAVYFSAPQYTGNVAWKRTDNNTPLSGVFAADTAYTATVTLSAASGYTFAGVGANAFAHSGKSSISNAANTGTVVIAFLSTDPSPATTITTPINLTVYVPAPITGATPVTSFNAGTYTGNVTWTTTIAGVAVTIFEADTEYRAAVTLYPAAGYAFPASVPATHSGSSGAVSNFTGNPRQGTIAFPRTGVLVFFSGPFSGSSTDSYDSVIDLIRAAKTAGHEYLYLMLSPRVETANLAAGTDLGTTGLVLNASNSPAKVIIDGGKRTVQVGIMENRSLITVETGVTLTLRNITLKDTVDNTAPIVSESGGDLIQETGVVINENVQVSWEVSTFAGSGAAGLPEGIGTAVVFDHPNDVALDGEGNLYVVDDSLSFIRKITSDGYVSIFAGSDTSGYVDGFGMAAQFNRPYGVAVDSAGNLYVADTGNNRIRKITPGRQVSTLAGSGASGYTDGLGTAARFNRPYGVAVDSAGNVYVADVDNNRIRKIAPNGQVSTLAGEGSTGYVDGLGTAALFNRPYDVAVDGAGNVYVVDRENSRIRKITPTGVVTTFAGSSPGYADGTGTAAQFNVLNGVTLDARGNLYVSDNQRIRRITPDGVVTTLAGGSPGYADGTGTAARFETPSGLAVDASGNLYVGDSGNNRIRKMTPVIP